jgi:predicted nucleotidyltransferase
MRQSEAYALPEIHDFFLQNKLVLQGVSAYTHQQNIGIVSEMQKAAEQLAPDLLAVQLIGSRANGTSCHDSDVDIAVVAYDKRHHTVATKLGATLREALYPLEVDTGYAAAYSGVRSIPSDPRQFKARAFSFPFDAFPLFEEGVFHTPNLTLGALAATEVMKDHPRRDAMWGALRRSHTDAYVCGPAWRMRGKLFSRVEPPEPPEQPIDRNMCLPPEVIRERKQRFGLPETFDEVYTGLQQWLDDNGDSVADTTGFRLLEEVRKA